MSLGLLGALGGLGKGITQYGQTLFSEAIEEKRQARLQAIRDKEYARSRADAQSDYDRARADLTSDRATAREQQLADIQSQREFQKGLLSNERDYNKDAITKIMKGDDGELIGFNRSGERTNLGTITVDDDSLSEYMRTFNSLNASLQAQGARQNDPTFASDFQLRANLMSAIANKLGGSQDNSAIIDEAMRDNPGKTRQEVEDQLRKLGIIF